MQYTKIYASPIGDLILASDGSALTGLGFWKQEYAERTPDKPEQSRAQDCRQDNQEEKAKEVFAETVKWLDSYFRGEKPSFMPEILLNGTEFQTEVWNILKTIPYGEIMTYGEIAGMIAKKRGLKRMSAQAVGQAVGHNPVGIIVPCHRVIGSNGSLTGYAGGLDKKIKLLAIERGDFSVLQDWNNK